MVLTTNMAIWILMNLNLYLRIICSTKCLFITVIKFIPKSFICVQWMFRFPEAWTIISSENFEKTFVATWKWGKSKKLMSGKNPCLATCTGYNFSICSNVLKQIHNDSVRPSRWGPQDRCYSLYTTRHDDGDATRLRGVPGWPPEPPGSSTNRPKLRIRIVGMCQYL